MSTMAAFGNEQLDRALVSILGLGAEASPAVPAPPDRRSRPALRDLHVSRQASVAAAASLGFALIEGLAVSYGDRAARWIGDARDAAETSRAVHPSPPRVAAGPVAGGPSEPAPPPAVAAVEAVPTPPLEGVSRIGAAPSAAPFPEKRDRTQTLSPRTAETAASTRAPAHGAGARGPVPDAPARLASVEADVRQPGRASAAPAPATEADRPADPAPPPAAPAQEAHARRDSVDAIRALRWQW